MFDRGVFRSLAAEAIGSFFLFACVVGSGIMAERLSGGNDAVALLGNTVATAGMLFVLITIFAPISGAHFNPVVSMVMAIRRELPWAHLLPYIIAQLIGGLVGIIAAHVMFDLPILQISTKIRSGSGQMLGEMIATFGLVTTIIGTARHRPDQVAMAVALYIVAGYWFTSSTSFANPAITIARMLTNSFAGIAPASVIGFIISQIVGALLATLVAKLFFDQKI